MQELGFHKDKKNGDEIQEEEMREKVLKSLREKFKPGPDYRADDIPPISLTPRAKVPD